MHSDSHHTVSSRRIRRDLVLLSDAMQVEVDTVGSRICLRVGTSPWGHTTCHVYLSTNIIYVHVSPRVYRAAENGERACKSVHGKILQLRNYIWNSRSAYSVN